MPLVEAEILGRAASPSIHLMGWTHGFSLPPDWAGRNVGNKYWNGTLALPVGAEKQEGILPVGEGLEKGRGAAHEGIAGLEHEFLWEFSPLLKICGMAGAV